MLLNEMSATEAAQLIARGIITSEALIRACLDRVAERERLVHAWATLDPELALREARQRDRVAGLGSLHGVPIAVKDVIETADLPTEMGSAIYRGYRPFADAACVAAVRAAGAIILGKTVTAEFAGAAPGPTANPRNLAHTPGGSSSGSAAAVADFMVPVAFGTQTGGSVLRPSSFCGIVGYKPTFGAFNRAGLKFAAESLDTIGLMARTLEDIVLVRDTLIGRRRASRTRAPITRPRIGLCRTHLWNRASSESKHAVESAASRLSAAGADVLDCSLPPEFERLARAREIINNVERARACTWEWTHHRDQISPQLSRWISEGLETPFEDYVDASALAERCRIQLDDLLGSFDTLIAPAVDGEAPEGLASTGDASFQGLWTILHVPTISMPTHYGPRGLPVGIQLIAGRYRDDDLIRIAKWVLSLLGEPMKTPVNLIPEQSLGGAGAP
jgi:amidase